MPEERDIEKLLHDYGKKRQEKAPDELHPATRRLLLGEVQRKYPQKGARSSLLWFGWWKQIAWGAGLCGVLALTIYVAVFPRSHSTEVAENVSESTPTQEVFLAKSEPAPAPEAPALEVSRDEGAVSSRQLAEPALLLADAPALSVNQPAPKALSDEFRVELKREALSFSEAKPAAPPAAPMPSAPPAPLAVTRPTLGREPSTLLLQSAPGAAGSPAGETVFYAKETSGALVAGTLFTNQSEDKQLKSADDKIARAESIAQPLQSFRFVQTASQVQLIEADGSIYTGAFETNTLARRAQRARFAAPNEEAGTPVSPLRAFLVTGTNATSGQRLTVRGVAQFDEVLRGLTQKVAPAAPTRTTATNADRAKVLAPVRVEAKATFDNGRQVEIRAVRANP